MIAEVTELIRQCLRVPLHRGDRICLAVGGSSLICGLDGQHSGAGDVANLVPAAIRPSEGIAGARIGAEGGAAAGHRVRIEDDGNRACGIPRHDVLQIMKNPQSAGLIGLVRDHRADAQASLEFGYSGIGYRDLISSTLAIQAP